LTLARLAVERRVRALLEQLRDLEDEPTDEFVLHEGTAA
jgi:hypothetical protein